MIAVGGIERTELVKDVISSQLKTFGYRSLFAITIGPIICTISLSLYVIDYGTKVHNLTIGLSKLGGKIMKGELGGANLPFTIMDLALFGEFIAITDSDMMILHNKTAHSLCDIVDNLKDVSE